MKRHLLSTCLALAAVPAMAQDWHLGLGAGRASLDVPAAALSGYDANPSADRRDTAWSMRLGRRLGRHVAMEASYEDLGTCETAGFGGVGARWHAAANVAVFVEYQRHAGPRVDAVLAGAELRF